MKLSYLFIFSVISCGESDSRADILKKSHIDSSLKITAESTHVISNNEDSLSRSEKQILKTICSENDFLIYSEKVIRTYSSLGSSLISSKVLYSDSTLKENGFLYLEIFFNNTGPSINVSYQYNRGQGAYGYGSFIGDDIQNYIHTINSCGLSACVTQIFKSGKKIFEKDDKID